MRSLGLGFLELFGSGFQFLGVVKIDNLLVLSFATVELVILTRFLVVDVVTVVVVEVVVLGVVIGTLLPAPPSTVARAVTNIGTFSTTGLAFTIFPCLVVILGVFPGMALGPWGILSLVPLGCSSRLFEGIQGGRAGLGLVLTLGSEGIAFVDLDRQA